MSHEKSSRGSQERQKQSLGQRLTEQGCAPSRECQPERQFTLARGATREKKIAHVYTSNEQYRADRSEQQNGRGDRSPVAVWVGSAANCLDDDRRRSRSYFCVLRADLSGDGPEIGCRLRSLNTIFEASKDQDAWPLGVFHLRRDRRVLVCPNSQGNPNVGPQRREQPCKFRRRDADHRVPLRLGTDLLAQYMGVAREHALPVVVADDREGLVFIGNPSAKERVDSQGLCIVWRNRLRRRGAALSLVIQAGLRQIASRKGFERTVALPRVGIVGIRKRLDRFTRQYR